MVVNWSIVEAIGTWFSGIITAGTLLFMYVQYRSDKKISFLKQKILVISTHKRLEKVQSYTEDNFYHLFRELTQAINAGEKNGIYAHEFDDIKACCLQYIVPLEREIKLLNNDIVNLEWEYCVAKKLVDAYHEYCPK